jgi:hypothetical protein
MGAVDYVIIALVALILGGAAWYVWRAKKKGAKCIGCPDAKTCSGNCGGCQGCGCRGE